MSIRPTTAPRDTRIDVESVDGIPWWKAPRPFWLHRCKAQTTGWVGPVGLNLVERCACGAINLDRRGWMERNSRRRDERRDWSVAVVLAVCIAGALIFLALLGPAEHVMCRLNDGHLAYCATDTTEPTR